MLIYACTNVQTFTPLMHGYLHRCAFFYMKGVLFPSEGMA